MSWWEEDMPLRAITAIGSLRFRLAEQAATEVFDPCRGRISCAPVKAFSIPGYLL